MAEAIASGRALRVYQVLLVLGLGWLAGRLPWLTAETRAEEGRLVEALGGARAGAVAAMPSTGTDREPPDVAAEVAAQVAAQVANETIIRLIAAGWGPGGTPAPVRVVVETAGPSSVPTVVRVVHEGSASLGWTLPPGPPAPAPAPSAAGLAPARTAPAQTADGAAEARKLAADGAAEAHKLASAGYDALRAGDRRAAAQQLAAAIAMAPAAPEAEGWTRDLKQLTRRWTVAAYTLSRGGGSGDPLAASPVLGGGQSGAAVAYALNPLAKRRVSLFGRVTAAAGPDGGLDNETTEGALGVRFQPFARVPLAIDAERRFALGAFGRNAFAARLSGGTGGQVRALGRPLDLEGFAEAGIVGADERPDLYAGGQGRGATPLVTLGKLSVDAGAGGWGAVQRDFFGTASRLDLGPSARFRVNPWAFTAQFDYRARVAGNALPGSGPVLTVYGEF